jgi:hypothetical protein
MVRDEQDGTLVRHGLDVFQTVDAHQVVRAEPNPTHAERALAERPETFPRALIHPPRHAKSHALHRREHAQFFRRRFLQSGARLAGRGFNLCRCWFEVGRRHSGFKFQVSSFRFKTKDPKPAVLKLET